MFGSIEKIITASVAKPLLITNSPKRDFWAMGVKAARDIQEKLGVAAEQYSKRYKTTARQLMTVSIKSVDGLLTLDSIQRMQLWERPSFSIA